MDRTIVIRLERVESLEGRAIKPTGVPSPAGAIRIIVGCFFLWGAFVAGIAVNVIEIYWFIEGIRQMIGGSCSAALIGLIIGVPLAPIGPILFGIGVLFVRRSDLTAFRLGLAGLIMSLLAFPVWLLVASLVAAILGLG